MDVLLNFFGRDSCGEVKHQDLLRLVPDIVGKRESRRVNPQEAEQSWDMHFLFDLLAEPGPSLSRPRASIDDDCHTRVFGRNGDRVGMNVGVAFQLVVSHARLEALAAQAEDAFSLILQAQRHSLFEVRNVHRMGKGEGRDDFF